MMKVCRVCNIEKPLCAYTLGKGTCMLCRRNIRNEKYKKAKDIQAAATLEERQQFYKEVVEPNQHGFITPEQFEEMKWNPAYDIQLSAELPSPLNKWLDDPVCAEDHAKGLVKDRALVFYDDGSKKWFGYKFLLY